jgi:centrosomal protein CEP76
VRKGFIHDHAVLAACLFLGCELEDKKNEELMKSKAKVKPKNYVPLENRVFLCLGTLKANKNFHAWIMTINQDFNTVIFWDVQDNHHYELKGRIAKR